MIINSHIQGIPCQIDVTYIEARTPTHYGSTPDWAEEGWGGELCWDVLDTEGNPSPELVAQMTSDDECRIEEEIETAYREEAEESRIP